VNQGHLPRLEVQLPQQGRGGGLLIGRQVLFGEPAAALDPELDGFKLGEPQIGANVFSRR